MDDRLALARGRIAEIDRLLATDHLTDQVTNGGPLPLFGIGSAVGLYRAKHGQLERLVIGIVPLARGAVGQSQCAGLSPP